MRNDGKGSSETQTFAHNDQFADAALLMALSSVRQVWDVHGWRVRDQNNTTLAEAEGLTNEFFFCLLGGYGITYEANLAAYQFLKREGCLRSEWLTAPNAPEDNLARKLSAIPKSIGEEKTDVFSYRFPNAKAYLLVRAASWLESTFAWDLAPLRLQSPREARQVLLTCPGMGYKTASWFLRNVGHGTGLAIVDVHLERLAKEWAIVPHGLTVQKDYLEIERRLLHICELVPARLDLLDLVLWHYARGDYNVCASRQQCLF